MSVNKGGRPKTCAGYVQWVEELLVKKWSVRKISKITGVSKSTVGEIKLAKERGEHY